MQGEGVAEKAEPGRTVREAVVLGAVADQAEELLGSIGRTPRMEIAPRVGRSRPVIRCIRVLLPEPLGPTRPVRPGSISTVTRLTPRTSP